MVDKSKNPEFWAAQEKWSAWHQEQLDEMHKETPNIIPAKTVEDFYGDCDHPNTMENSTATILYILVMIGSLIFKDFLYIWVAASFIYFRFITRHKR